MHDIDVRFYPESLASTPGLDKSEQAAGALELAVDGSVHRARLGPLRDNF